MKLWMLWFPLLFIPNLSDSGVTEFGTFTTADLFIVPYIFLVFLRVYSKPTYTDSNKSTIYFTYLIPTIWFFISWAAISTLSIAFRYDYISMNQTYFGILKLAKMILYGLAAILTIFAIAKSSKHEKQLFLWVFVTGGALIGGYLFLVGNVGFINTSFINQLSSSTVFRDNETTVLLSLFISFLTGMVINGNGSKAWRIYAIVGLFIMGIGIVFSRGRGGWVATIIALIYIAMHVDVRKTFIFTFLSISFILFAYNSYPIFRYEVDRTLHPDENYLRQYNAGIFGIDLGARLPIFVDEIPKIADNPLLGRGLFHRGGKGGLLAIGSHNFFLQMFLELGIPGGIAFTAIILQMWKHTRYLGISEIKLSLPVQATIVSAVISGLSGEYFYGGLMLFVFLTIYGFVGSIESDTQRHYLPEISNHVSA